MFSFAKSLLVVATVAATVSADHGLTLINRCGFGVNMKIDNWSGAAYNGAQPPTVGANGGVWSTTLPNGWDGRICDNRDCYAGGSMTEYNLDAGGLSYYDISNIIKYSVPQQIQVAGGQTVTCQSASCACDQAYGPGNTAGTCPGSGTPDRPVRATGTGNAGITVVYCP